MGGGDDSAGGFFLTAHCFILVHSVWRLSCLKRLSPAKLVTISIHVTKMAIRLEGNEERMAEEGVAARWRCGEGQFMHGSCFHGLITAESAGYQCFMRSPL